jgi:hypothetical protein
LSIEEDDDEDDDVEDPKEVKYSHSVGAFPSPTPIGDVTGVLVAALILSEAEDVASSTPTPDPAAVVATLEAPNVDWIVVPAAVADTAATAVSVAAVGERAEDTDAAASDAWLEASIAVDAAF